MFKNKIGLVLGGGGAKGLAHIGVLKFLEEKNIHVDYVSGTSIGAVIGTLHCLGYKASEIESLVKKTKFKSLFDIGAPRKGLIKGDKIESYFRELFEEKKFSDLKKPLFVVACDLNNFQEVVFNKGDLARAVRASISIPGIFMPVINKDRVLVDGGVLDNLPVQIMENQGADTIIAVNLEAEKIKNKVYESAVSEKNSKEVPNIIETLLKTYVMITSVPLENIFQNPKNSIIISPPLEEIKIQNFNKANQAIEIGYKAAKENASQLERLSQRKGPFSIFKKF